MSNQNRKGLRGAPGHSDFAGVFHLHSPMGRSRSAILFNTALCNIGSAFTTGALYTAFLAENGLDIVRVGIITLIPYISWVLSLLSPMIMRHFPRRRGILIFNSVCYYSCVTLATTIMPLFVKDPEVKTWLFALFLFIANASNALLGNGCTTWILRFIPQGDDLNVYTQYNNLVGLVLTNLFGIGAAIAATALEASSHRLAFLVGLRLFAFVLFIVAELVRFLVPPEISLPVPEKPFSPVFLIREPLRHKPFMGTVLILIIWNFLVAINASTFSYYILETVKVPLVLMYLGNITTALTSLLLSGRFRRIADRISPYRTMAVFALLFAVNEGLYAMVAPGRTVLYVFCVITAAVISVGFVMGYNSLLYLNLPKGSNTDVFVTFWNLIGNLASLGGSAFGTWLLATLGSRTPVFFGLELYSSQILCMIKSLCCIGFFLLVWCMTPYLQKNRTG